MENKDILLNRLHLLVKKTRIKSVTKKNLTEMALLNLLNDFELYENNPDGLEDVILNLIQSLSFITNGVGSNG